MFCGFCFAQWSQIWFSAWLCKQACWHRGRAGSSISHKRYRGRLRRMKSCQQLMARLCGAQPVLLSPAVMLTFFFFFLFHAGLFPFLKVWNSLWLLCNLWGNERIQTWMDLCRQSLQLIVLVLSVPFEAVSLRHLPACLFSYFSAQKLSNPFIASFPLHQGSRNTSWREHLTTLMKNKHFFINTSLQPLPFAPFPPS